MDYIKWIRSKVGSEMIILNFAGAMEIGESADETAKREVEEETGLKINIEELIGIYTKYFDEYPNGDRAQTIAFFYKGSICGGEIINENEESIELRFLNKDEVPELFNQQHNDVFNDFINKRTGVYR
ncbi:NUDIX domain-containing protein [Paenibacillus gallinarum]|uniref:NUDIX domain-containing protein n=1 Tax=Paenibacillus gallinarum TaxID=2762232 RepID=A0ABR8T0H3_9BACL|nr:NUDIX domain-containing protein [Paenibacillus gallinarum]MBD7969264.1 NUDIX domain-containing protein [Paenibacillus gallinarum]